MSVPQSRRANMTLYSDPTCPYSHQVRIVIAEKGVNAEIIQVTSPELREQLAQVNPYGSLPTLVDRDLVLYSPKIINEYLEERFPHPPLLPVYPVLRAKSRLAIHRVDEDWYPLMLRILEKDDDKAREELVESLLSLAPVFAETPFFLSEEFNMIDCCIAPLLWRLPEMDITLPKKPGAVIEKYAERVFERAAFQKSLTESEQEMRIII